MPLSLRLQSGGVIAHSAENRSALTFPFPTPPAPGEVLEVLPGVYSLRLPLQLKLDHVNVWVLDDSDGFLVIDTGLADERTPQYLSEALAKLPQKPISRLLITHHHPDHCGLADRICEEHRAELLISDKAYEAAVVLQHHSRGTDAHSTAAGLARYGLSPWAQRYLIDNATELDALRPGMPSSYTGLRDGDTVSVGKYECQVIFGQGHAPDHVSLYSPGAGRGGAGGFLISGDMLLPRISTHVGSPATWQPGNPVTQFRASVRRLGALPADTFILPSHGAPFYGAAKRVRELERHHEQRCLTLLKALDDARSAGELLQVVFQRDLDPVQLILAMNEAVAHLEYLTDRGDVQRLEGDDGVIRYART